MKYLVVVVYLVLMMTISACNGGTEATDADLSVGESKDAPYQSKEDIINYSAESTEGEKVEQEDTGLNQTEISQPKTPNGYPIMSVEEFMSYTIRVELTTENWKDFLDIDYVILEDKDAFGEVINSVRFPQWETKCGVCVQATNSVAFKIKDKKGKFGEVTFSTHGTNWFSNDHGAAWYDAKKSDVSIEDYDFVKAKGELCIINIPDDKWISYDGNPDLVNEKINGIMAYNMSDLERRCSNRTINKVCYVGIENDYCMFTDSGHLLYISPNSGSSYVGYLCVDTENVINSLSINEIFK